MKTPEEFAASVHLPLDLPDYHRDEVRQAIAEAIAAERASKVHLAGMGKESDK